MENTKRNVQWFIKTSLVALIINAGIGASLAVPIDISIDPKRAYITTDDVDRNIFGGLDVVAGNGIFELAALGISQGDVIRLELLGGYKQFPADGDVPHSMGGVFSSSNTLLPSSPLDPNRIPGAIDAGVDNITGVTFQQKWATDIAEDFLIFDTVVEVPQLAQYIFIAALDATYGDNSDPNGDYGVRISQIPEPSAFALLVIGLLSFGFMRRRQGNAQ